MNGMVLLNFLRLGCDAFFLELLKASSFYVFYWNWIVKSVPQTRISKLSALRIILQVWEGKEKQHLEKMIFCM